MSKYNKKNQALFFLVILLFVSISIISARTNKVEVTDSKVQSTKLTEDVRGDNEGGVVGQNKTINHPQSTKVLGKVDSQKSFSLIVLPDTQKYAKDHPDIFCNQTDWVVKEKSNLNIMATVQLGDIVDSGGESKKEWEVASKCLKTLFKAGVWALLPGNHDTDKKSDVESGFDVYDLYFPSTLFSGYSWYKEHFRNNQNSFVTFDSLGMKVGLLNLSIEPDDEALAWARKTVKAYSDHFIILSTHKYLLDGSNTRDVGLDFSKNGNDGESIWQELVKDNCNIRLVLGGHFHIDGGEGRLISKNTCGQNVLQTIQDYQSREKGGNGRLRIYTFTPQENKVNVETYSPYTKLFESDGDSEFNFSY